MPQVEPRPPARATAKPRPARQQHMPQAQPSADATQPQPYDNARFHWSPHTDCLSAFPHDHVPFAFGFYTFRISRFMRHIERIHDSETADEREIAYSPILLNTAGPGRQG